MINASQLLTEIEQVTFDKNKKVQPQLESMKSCVDSSELKLLPIFVIDIALTYSKQNILQ